MMYDITKRIQKSIDVMTNDVLRSLCVCFQKDVRKWEVLMMDH